MRGMEFLEKGNEVLLRGHLMGLCYPSSLCPPFDSESLPEGIPLTPTLGRAIAESQALKTCS